MLVKGLAGQITRHLACQHPVVHPNHTIRLPCSNTACRCASTTHNFESLFDLLFELQRLRSVRSSAGDTLLLLLALVRFCSCL